jgi:hypothetical protein
MVTIKPPLGIFVIWHPEFRDGELYANLIFSQYKRDVTDPLSRGIGIPVFFRCHEPLLEIDFDFYKNTSVIILIDANMVNAAGYETYVNQILKDASNSTLILPVAIDNTAYNLSHRLSGFNFIRLYEKGLKTEYLIAALSHEISRHLHLKKNLKKGKNKTPPPPLKLFISHAKADGVDLARKIKAYIESEYAFKTFFDANDIAFGYDFPQEIDQNLENAVFIAIHTDKYASREWCRREVLLAKQHNRPILILTCLKDGESRSFPYMANVRTVHYHPLDDRVWPRLISAVMQETLRVKYQELWAKYVILKKKLPIDPESVFAYPPELVTVLTRKKILKKTFFYPDPPLGTEELAILKQLDPGIKFLTPSSFLRPSTLKSKSGSCYIGISISECEDMKQLGLGHAHLQDTMIEAARHLLYHGFNLVYGGDPNYRAEFNFTELLLQMAQTYCTETPSSGRIFIYSAFPLYTKISARKEAELKRVATVVKVSPPDLKNWEKVRYESASPTEKEFLDKLFDKKIDLDSQMLWTKSLTLMREEMTKKVNARIVMGGKLVGFKGKYPGILEETLIDLDSENRVFLVDSMGGCSKMIRQLLKSRNVAGLEELQNRQQEFITYYNSKMKTQPIDYGQIQKRLEKGKKYLNIYSDNEMDNLISDLTKHMNKMNF